MPLSLFDPVELQAAGERPQARPPEPERKGKRPDGYGREMFDPSPEEIRRLCREEIQRDWSPREERKRAGTAGWLPPLVTVAEEIG